MPTKGRHPRCVSCRPPSHVAATFRSKAPERCSAAALRSCGCMVEVCGARRASFSLRSARTRRFLTRCRDPSSPQAVRALLALVHGSAENLKALVCAGGAPALVDAIADDDLPMETREQGAKLVSLLSKSHGATVAVAGGIEVGGRLGGPLQAEVERRVAAVGPGARGSGAGLGPRRKLALPAELGAPGRQ